MKGFVERSSHSAGCCKSDSGKGGEVVHVVERREGIEMTVKGSGGGGGGSLGRKERG